RQGRLRDIRVIYAERLVNTSRSYVTHHGRQIADNLMLDIEVPLRDVTAMRVLLGVTPALLIPTVSRPRRYWEQCIRSRKERPLTRAVDRTGEDEREVLRGRGKIHIAQREDIEDPETPAHGRLSVMERVPGKSDARLKVMKGVIPK